MSIKQDRGTPFSVTASGTATATATKAAATGVIHYITDIGCSIGTTTFLALGTVTVFSGTTALWQEQIFGSSYERSFSTPLTGTVGGAVSVTAYGTVATYVNMAGFDINAT